MIFTGITVLLPVFFVLGLGYFAGRAKQFDADQIRGFNELVLDYAMPAMMFVATVKTPRWQLLGEGLYALALLVAFVGLFLIVVCLAMLMQKQTMVETADAIVADRPLMLVLGLIALIAGLAIVLKHNVWSGGALPVVVTLCGWVMLMRGLLLLFVPPDVMVRLWSVLRFDEWFYVYAGVVMALGLYLTYAGFESTLAGFTARMRSIARRE